jgi:anti-anti-sigma regulatory factor
LVFDAEAVTHVDVAALAALRELAGQLEEAGTALLFARLKSQTRERFDQSGLSAEIGLDRFHPTVHAAVEASVAG